MRYVATPEFLDRYMELPDSVVGCVDLAIQRLLANPGSSWARQGRLAVDDGPVWLISVACQGTVYVFYWRQGEDTEPIELLLLLKRD